MKKKHPKALTATRVRYRVFVVVDGNHYVRRTGKKKSAFKVAAAYKPADVHDTMARIGSPQVWRVDETGIHCIKRRT